MNLRKGDEVVSAMIVDEPDLSLLVVGENGFGKRTPLSEYRPQNRGGYGLITMNVTAKTGPVIGAEIVEQGDQLVIMSTHGKAIRLRIDEIRTVGRIAQGVKLIDLTKGDQVASIARVITESDDGAE